MLPDWLRIMWVAIYALILVLHLVLHLRHLNTMGGQERTWHSSHVLMALGMVYMFLPAGIITLPSMVGIVVFALAALAATGWIVYALASQRPLDFLWVILLIDMLGMAYMFAITQVMLGALTYLFAVYFVIEMGCWFLGAFNQFNQFNQFTQPDPHQQVFPATVGAVALKANARPLASASSLTVRLTLGLMAAGMAYMFLAMLVGM